MFRKDVPLFVLFMMPVWIIGGIGWAVVMWLVMGGTVAFWFLGGLCWGVGCWMLSTPLFLFLMRERTAYLDGLDPDEVEERLEEELAKLRYVIESRSRRRIVCKPRRRLAWEFMKVEIVFDHDEITLTGPAGAVNALRKRLAD